LNASVSERRPKAEPLLAALVSDDRQLIRPRLESLVPGFGRPEQLLANLAP
jgi:hypothetical protein